MSDDLKASVKKKWRVNREDGPLVLAAEHVQKRMAQHRYPCDYEVTPHGVTFSAGKGRDLCPRFVDVLAIAVRIVNADLKISVRLFSTYDGPTIVFDFPHEINSRGDLVRRKLCDIAAAQQPTR